MDIHAVSRIWWTGQTKHPLLSREDVLAVLRNKPNFEDVVKDRRVYFSAAKQVAFLQSKTDNAIVTFIRTQKPKAAKEWKRTAPDNY